MRNSNSQLRLIPSQTKQGSPQSPVGVSPGAAWSGANLQPQREAVPLSWWYKPLHPCRGSENRHRQPAARYIIPILASEPRPGGSGPPCPAIIAIHSTHSSPLPWRIRTPPNCHRPPLSIDNIFNSGLYLLRFPEISCAPMAGPSDAPAAINGSLVQCAACK